MSIRNHRRYRAFATTSGTEAALAVTGSILESVLPTYRSFYQYNITHRPHGGNNKCALARQHRASGDRKAQ